MVKLRRHRGLSLAIEQSSNRAIQPRPPLSPAPAAPANSARRDPPPSRDLLLLLSGFVLVYFLPTGLRSLANPDEGRYVEIAREMAVTGDYISPHLNGVLYFEKPPLVYWLEAGAIKIGGMNLWALRFWPIALAFLGVAAVYGTGRALWGRAAGLWSAAALGTSLLYFGVAQVIILDTAVSVFLTFALCAFLLAVRAPPGPTRRRWCWALYASMALALLTKGLIGVVIPCAIIFLWLLLLNKWRELRHAHLFSGVAILLILALPWHIAAALANPPPGGWNWAHFFSTDRHNQGFLWYYFIHEHVLRYIDPTTEHRVQPWWFFSAILVAGFYPWVFFLPQAIRSAAQGGWVRMKAEPEILLLFLWILFPLLFFSASSSKLVPYIVPSVPPLALLVGRWLAKVLVASSALALIRPLRALGVFALVLAVAMAVMALLGKIPPTVAPWIGGLIPLFILLSVATLISTHPRRGKLRDGLSAILGCTALLLMVFNPIASDFTAATRPSTAAVADWLRPRLREGDQVFTLWDYGPFQDFAPLLGRTVGVAGQIPDEQEFGLTLETSQLAPRYPGLVEYLALPPNPTVAQVHAALLPPFVRLLRGPARAYVLVAANQYPLFQQAYPDAPAHLVWHDDHFVLFCNQAVEIPD